MIGSALTSDVAAPTNGRLLDGDAYAAQQRSAWDAKDFASLFDRQFRQVPNGSDAQHQSNADTATAERVQSADATSDRQAAASMKDAEYSAETVGIEQDSGSAPSAVADTSPSVAGTGVAAFTTYTADIGPTSSTHSEYQIPQRLSERYAAAFDEAGASQVTMRMDGDQVHVWMRDPGVPAGTDSGIKALLLTHLSWLGLALASLKINGRSEVAVGKSENRPQWVETVESGHESVKQTSQENDHVGRSNWR